jgi:hypothetical protein
MYFMINFSSMEISTLSALKEIYQVSKEQVLVLAVLSPT